MIARAVIAAAVEANPVQHQVPADWLHYRLGTAGIGVPRAVSVVQASDLVVIGRLLRRRLPVRVLSPDAAAKIVASDGRVLVEDYWGSYLALWRDRRDGSVCALRDPSGAVPLFRAGVGTKAVLFTDLADVWPLPVRPEVDWDGLTHRLLYPQRPTARTSLRGVAAILPGEACRIDGLEPPRLLWSPWRFADEALNPRSMRVAAATVRKAVDTATAALVPATKLLLELSGGLDSSILAASLDAAGADWAAVTIVTPAADGDERRFASAVADHFGVRLHALQLTPGDLDLLAAPRQRTTSPTGFGMLAGLDRAIGALVKREHIEGLVSGIGGDNVFCSLRSPSPIIDAWRDKGLRQALRTADDLGQLSGSDRWTILLQTFRSAARDRRRPERWTFDASFLAPDVRPSLEPHPWLTTSIGRRAGRRAHIVMLLRAHAVATAHERARRDGMQVPLLAQPVLEACLAIPAWRWIEGGRDRAAARTAFADRLPRMIIERRSKGRLESLLAPAYDRDRARLRDRLADGRLAAAGVIDREAVIAACVAPASATDDIYIRLLELVDAELWLDGLG